MHFNLMQPNFQVQLDRGKKKLYNYSYTNQFFCISVLHCHFGICFCYLIIIYPIILFQELP